VKTYPYYDAATGGLRFDAMLAALRGAAGAQRRAAARLLPQPHRRGPEPRAVGRADPGAARARKLLPYLDLAYQGFGDGIDEDAYAVRALADAGLTFFVANSFSKSMSVYGERAAR
jgi:aromatic-amino-acid transaminase